MIKVLGLALYGQMAASTRYRLGQYVSGLAEQGIALEVCSLLGDDYLRRRFSGKAPPVSNMLQSGWRRLRELRDAKSIDLTVLYGELFPMLPGWAETALLPRPYIYDFDDAFYLKYTSGKLGLLRPVLGGKFHTVMKGAAAITAGNSVLTEYARGRNNNAHLLPTVVDTDRYIPSVRLPNRIFTVGWIGSPSTSPYLAELALPLSQLAKEGPVKLIVVGGKAPEMPNVAVEEIPWSEQTEVALINSFDVGVMPLADDDWARGKCAFKLIQYMACAVPVVASKVGANVDVVQPDCGLLVNSEQEWLTSFRFLRDHGGAACTMGAAGRERIEVHYSLQRNLPILADVIRKAVDPGS